MRRPDINSRPGKTQADPAMVTSSDIIKVLDRVLGLIEGEQPTRYLEAAIGELIDLRIELREMK